MSVIKQTDIPTYTGLPDATLQAFRENPRYAYRELLMQNGGADVDYAPIPYIMPCTADEPNWFRIPHGMSEGAAARDGVTGPPATPNTVAAGHERIPDVAIPILIEASGSFTHLTRPSIALLAHPLSGSTTGWWADESYIYIAISVAVTGTVGFVVYVEYTHSVIRNEIITGQPYNVTPAD
jgi:hypothetical protein